MMLSSGSGDSNGVFSLLAALSDPEAAKSRLKEIDEASSVYQKVIEDFRVESNKTKADLDAQRTDIEDKLSEATRIKTENDSTIAARTKKLSDWESDLSRREAIVTEADQKAKALIPVLSSREDTVSKREQVVSSREDSVQQLQDTAQKLKDTYEAQYAALKQAMGL